MEGVLELLGWASLLGGGVLVVIGGVGMLRFPDFYTRLHAASLTDTLGAGLILIGLATQSGTWIELVKLAMVLLFLLFTGATAAHALAKSARHGNVEPLLDTSPGGDDGVHRRSGE